MVISLTRRNITFQTIDFLPVTSPWRRNPKVTQDGYQSFGGIKRPRILGVNSYEPEDPYAETDYEDAKWELRKPIKLSKAWVLEYPA